MNRWEGEVRLVFEVWIDGFEVFLWVLNFFLKIVVESFTDHPNLT